MTKRNHPMTTHIHLHIHTIQDGEQPTLEVQKPDQVSRLEHGRKEQPFLEFDQMWESGMYEDLETTSAPQMVSPEEMNEVLDYYKNHYRYSIEVHFMDYKGQELDTFSDEQYQARIGEIKTALDRLPIPPTFHMYGSEYHTAVWMIPEQRRFLTTAQFDRISDNFLKMIRTIGISTPILTEDYYDSDLKWEYQPKTALYRIYHETVKPLAEFDRISSLRISVEEAE